MSARLLNRGNRPAAFTLAEMMVGMAAGALILMGLTLGSVSLQRSFSSGDAYATAQDSQLRVMDYLTRDLRRANTVTVSGDGTQVSVTVPDYYDNYDSTGNPSMRSAVNSQPRDPVLTGTKLFGSYDPIITYYVDSTTQSLVRQVDWQVSGVAKQSKTVIADGIANFVMAFQNYSSSVIQAQITFLPKFERNSAAMARAGTTLNASVTLRDAPL